MKRLIKAFLWITCYGGACWFGIKAKLGFDLINPNHWKALFDKFVRSPWPAGVADKKVVCKVLLAFIIVGILGLSIICRKKKTRIPLVKGELPDKADFRPSMLASQGRIVASAPAPAPATTPASPSTGIPIPEQVNIESPTLTPMSEIISQIMAIANAFDTSVFQHVKLEDTFTQAVISDDSTALLLKILPQRGVWHVEQAPIPQESQWKIDGEPPKNALKDIMESTATLARLEPEAQTITVVLLAGGSLENPSEVKNYLNQNGIRLVSLDDQTSAEIPSLHSLLDEFYPPKQKENSDETDSIEQNQ